MRRRDVVIGGLAMLLGAAGAVVAANVSSPPVAATDKAAIEKIVRDYILANPEILPEAMKNLEAREGARAVSTHRKALETPFGTAWEGAADADVTVVQFFDYNCGYCRAARADIDKLLVEDRKLRVVYREVPILGEDSLKAARASLAAAQGGNYIAFHKALYDAGRATASSIGNVRSKVNPGGTNDAGKIDAEINANIDLLRSLQLTGTPGWVVGDQLLNGAVGYDALKAAIAEARAKG